jgi:hypothetical protein
MRAWRWDGEGQDKDEPCRASFIAVRASCERRKFSMHVPVPTVAVVFESRLSYHRMPRRLIASAVRRQGHNAHRHAAVLSHLSLPLPFLAASFQMRFRSIRSH